MPENKRCSACLNDFESDRVDIFEAIQIHANKMPWMGSKSRGKAR